MPREFQPDDPTSPAAPSEAATRQLIYVSTTTQRHSDSDMDALLAQCRRNNATHGITGMLLYKDGHFMQVLEGHPDRVDAIYARILGDPRHRESIVVLDRGGTGRDFPDWTMGYRRVDAGEVPGEGFNDVLLQSAEPGETAPLAVRFLKRLAENIRE